MRPLWNIDIRNGLSKVCASFILRFLAIALAFNLPLSADELLMLENDEVAVGIDREMGASITWLSWRDSPRNAVNSYDPGRLIQQSYYAGQPIDRVGEGQSKAWSPWPWNPIQGGGIASRSRVTRFERTEAGGLASETVPKLWDMADEEASAVMRQWTSFEPGMPDVVRVRCEFVSQRTNGDRWGLGNAKHQEIPACYFTRDFDNFKSYLGSGSWRDESQAAGPPWGRTTPPKQSMAVFNAQGQGIAIFSPGAKGIWNFGPHASGTGNGPKSPPCVHVAPLVTVQLMPKSIFRFRYWLVVGDADAISKRLDSLIASYAAEAPEFVALPDKFQGGLSDELPGESE